MRFSAAIRPLYIHAESVVAENISRGGSVIAYIGNDPAAVTVMMRASLAQHEPLPGR
jgi:hypothetical protein